MSEQRERHELAEAAGRHLERRRRAARERRGAFWLYLSYLGSLGWLVVLPTLAGAALGRLLDRSLHGGITFSAAGVLAGAALGMWLLWKRLHGERP